MKLLYLTHNQNTWVREHLLKKLTDTTSLLNKLAGFPKFFLVDFLDPAVQVPGSSPISSAGCAGADTSTISSLSSDFESKEAAEA